MMKLIKDPMKLEYIQSNLDKITLLMFCGNWSEPMTYIDLRQCEVNGDIDDIIHLYESRCHGLHIVQIVGASYNDREEEKSNLESRDNHTKHADCPM